MDARLAAAVERELIGPGPACPLSQSVERSRGSGRRLLLLGGIRV